MKLNPPETAPRDGTVFLAYLNLASQDYPVGTCFRCEFVPAFYDSGYGFLFAYVDMDFDDDADENRTFFDTENCDGYTFIGWLPMPKVDAEGNVVMKF